MPPETMPLLLLVSSQSPELTTRANFIILCPPISRCLKLKLKKAFLKFSSWKCKHLVYFSMSSVGHFDRLQGKDHRGHVKWAVVRSVVDFSTVQCVFESDLSCLLEWKQQWHFMPLLTAEDSVVLIAFLIFCASERLFLSRLLKTRSACCIIHRRHKRLSVTCCRFCSAPALFSVSVTHAVELCMSCQPLLKLLLSSLRGPMPSFCFSSACCFSLDDRTCLSVLISSSSWDTHTQRQLLYWSFHRLRTSNTFCSVAHSEPTVPYNVPTYFSQLLQNLLPLLLGHDGVVEVDFWCRIFIGLSQRLRV